MNRLLFVLLFGIACISCSNKNLNKYNDLKSHFSEEEILLIDKMLSGFDSFLKKQYSSGSSNHYEAFLKDVSTMSVKYFDYEEKEDLIQEVKESSLFSKVWTKCPTEEEDNNIITVEEDKVTNIEKANPIFYCLNPKGSYFDFLKAQTANTELNKLYFALSKSYDMNSLIYSNELLKILKSKDYEDITVMVNISIVFYYDSILNLNKE